MFKKIMVPVDLAHAQHLDKALSAAADLANRYKVPVTYVGITTATPSALAHTPAEYEQKLTAFAQAQATAHGHQAEAKAIVSHDPASDLEATLLKAVDDTGADLVVMATHNPGLAEWIWPSNGGTIASHSSASVFVVR